MGYRGSKSVLLGIDTVKEQRVDDSSIISYNCKVYSSPQGNLAFGQIFNNEYKANLKKFFVFSRLFR